MARKSDTLTPRQRQSARIMREKAAGKRRKEWLRRAQLIASALAVVLGLAGGVWVWKNNIIERSIAAVVDGAYGITINAGFALDHVYLEGRNRTKAEDIDRALDINTGDAILRLSLDEARARLEAIPSIKTAAVERALPGTLYVRIVEREPVALWQQRGKLALVDDKGVVMEDIGMAAYRHLPLIVGSGAPAQVSEILSLLASQPELLPRFAAAVRVGERRWNVRLQNGVDIKLPENNPQAAWKKLAELHAKEQLLDRDARVIDLRMDGRLFITVSPKNAAEKPAAGAKET